MNERITCYTRMQWLVLSLAWILGILRKQQRFIHLSSFCCIPREYRVKLNAALELWTDSLQHFFFEMTCSCFSFCILSDCGGRSHHIDGLPASVFLPNTSERAWTAVAISQRGFTHSNRREWWWVGGFEEKQQPKCV